MFEYDVCVIGGGGHVGLPLAISFASRGLGVVVQDRDAGKVAVISDGRMPFLENDAEPALEAVLGKTLSVTTETSVVSSARNVVVVIGTPVDEHLNPTSHKILRFFQDLAPHLREGQCIILRSTVAPGTTEKVDELLKAAGVGVHVAFCPERVAEGKAMTELRTLPQIVSGCGETAFEMARELFATIAPSLIRMTPLEAELAKIFANAWRYIQFATANQFFMVALDYGLDFHKIHEGLTKDYPRMAGLPTSGFSAGPCLFKDTMQLAASAKNNFWLGHAAMVVNEGLPGFVVHHVKQRYPLAKMRVGILGMAFKADSDDPRESLSYKLRKVLTYEAAEVLCTDVHIVEPSILPLDDVLHRADIFIVGAPHKEYRSITFPPDKPVIDIWNFYKKGTGLT